MARLMMKECKDCKKVLKAIEKTEEIIDEYFSSIGYSRV